MLVIDQNTLQAVNLLNFIDQIGSQCLDTLDGKNVMRCRIAVQDIVALFDGIAILKVERFALRNEILNLLDRVFMWFNHNPALVLVITTEADGTINLGDDSVVLGTTCFEQFGNPWKTTGNILGFRTFQWNTRKNITLRNLGVRCDRKNGIDRKEEAGFTASVQGLDLAVLVLDDNRRLEINTARCRTPVDNLSFGDAGRLIGCFRDRQAINNVFEFNCTTQFGHHRTCVRIPFSQTLSTFYRVTIVDKDL